IGAHAPPVADGHFRLRAHGAGQFLVHEQPDATLPAKSSAARTGDAALAPAGNDDLAIAVEADGPVAALQGGCRVRAVQQAVAVGVFHGFPLTPPPPTSASIRSPSG